jgi:hypothetical protein
MREPEGVLPSRVESADERGMLPPVVSDEMVTPSPVPPETPSVPVTTDATIVDSRSIEERLAAITAAGGLTVLPPNFGDANGDWTTVSSENPFIVLCLDPSQANCIEPEMVAHHRELLQRFWQEKLRSMSQGAARYAILKKYGGSDESERRVRSYPELIERAYEQLATRSGIEAAARRIERERETLVGERVDQKLEDLIVDGVLQPEEVRVLLEFGEREGVRRPVVAERIQQQLQRRGFVGGIELDGDAALEARLLSTAWMHPAGRPETTTTMVVVAPKKKSLLLPLFAFSLVVVLALLVAVALRTSEMPRVQDSVVLPATSVQIESTAQVPPAESSTQPPLTATVVTATLASAKVTSQDLPLSTATAEKPTNVDTENLRRVREELLVIKDVGGRDPQAALDRLSILEQGLGVENVAERLEAVQLRSAFEKALLLEERARAMEAAAEQARVEREREWDRRIASVEELMKQPNYSGAKALADQLLADPEIPPAAFERVKQLREAALAELQRIFAGAKVKSKTGRSSRGQ